MQQINMPIKLNIDQKFELQSAQANIVKSTPLTAMPGQCMGQTQVLDDAIVPQKPFTEQATVEVNS